MQPLDEDGVVDAVVDPALPQDAVLGGADEGVLGARQRVRAVGQGHLVGDRVGAGAVGHHHELDAHLALGVVERNPPALTGRGPSAQAAYQGRVGSHAVSSSVLPGCIVVRWMTAIVRFSLSVGLSRSPYEVVRRLLASHSHHA